MAHFASVNENQLISTIEQCKSNLDTVKVAELSSQAQNMNILGYETKTTIVNAAIAIDNASTLLKSELSLCLNIANKIKQYKAQKKVTDKLKKEVDQLKSEVAKFKQLKESAYSNYNSYKDNEDKQAEAQYWYNQYTEYKNKQEQKQKAYNKKKTEYDKAKEELNTIANVLRGMGFPPESN